MSYHFYDVESGLKVNNNEQNIVTDLLKLFSFIYYNKIPLLKNNKIRKNNYNKILKNFILVREASYLDFLLEFSINNKFLIHTDNYWDVNFERIIGFLQKTDTAFRKIYDFMIYKIRHDRKTKIILSVLKEVTTSRWISFDKFYHYLMSQSKSFIDPPTFFKNKYYANKQTSSNKQQTENLFALHLFWAGLVRITYNKSGHHISRSSTKKDILAGIKRIVENNSLNQDQLEDLPELDKERLKEIYDELYNLTKLDYDINAVALTPIGKALLNDRKSIAQFFPKKSSKFTIQPNFEIIIPPNFDEKKYFKLLSFIETVRTETLNTFKITKQSIYHAILEGWKQKEMEKFLKDNSLVKPPKNVMELMRDCFSQFNKIELYKNQYILKASRPVIRKIEHDTELKHYIQDKLNSETLLLKPKTNISKLVRKYKAFGLNAEIRTTETAPK